MSSQQKPQWLYVPEWLLDEVWHFPYAYETFKKYIPPQALILEVGFGSGRILSRLAKELDCRGVGIDPEERAFESLSFFCERHGVKVEAIKGSGFVLPFKDNSFDVVYSEGVLEHFPQAQSEAMVREHVRVCRQGGLVIVSVPNRFAIFHSLTKFLLGERFLFYPERSLSRFELCRWMTRAGLTPIAWDGFAFGCQFFMFKAFFLNQALPSWLETLASRMLTLLRGMSIYHFPNSRLNSLIGFQTLIVGHKKK